MTAIHDTITFEASLEQSRLYGYSVPTERGPVSVRELGLRFTDSEYGPAMREQPLRFSQNFGYSREQMLADLGDDLCPIGHQEQLLEYLEQVIDSEHREQTLFQLSDEEISVLGFVAVIHDIGESMHQKVADAHEGKVLGDKPSGTKTEEDKQLESSIRHFFYRDLYDDVDPTVIQQAEAIIAHDYPTLDQNGWTHLHEIYEAAHNLQTLNTVERAENCLDIVHRTLGQSDERVVALESLARQVRPSTVDKLEQYGYLTSVYQALENQPKDSALIHIVNTRNAPYHRICCGA